MSETIVYYSNVKPLKDEELFSKYYALMPEYRKEKIDKYLFIKDKLLSLGVGILLKKACADFNIKDKDEDVFFNQFNKPFFNNSNVYFSLSHSNEIAMCAISNCVVGCDVEYIDKTRENISNKVFTQNEIAEFDTTKPNGFYALWTLKESCLKKIGKGFALCPQKIEFDKRLKVSNDDKTCFYLDTIGEYNLACAYETETIKIINIDLTNDIL